MTTATRRPALRAALAAAATLALLVLTGACGVGSDSASDDDSGSSGGSGSVAEGPDRTGGGDSGGDGSADLDDAAAFDARDQQAVAASAPKESETVADEEQKLISNGSVQLKSDDVAKAIFDVRNVVDTYAGEIEANETETDDEGDPLRARLQLRVPTDRFDQAMQDLEDVAVLVASSGNTKDVTTEVLDKDIRVDVQRRSIERISLLLEQATSIRDVVAIEAQLSQRQADLAVLEKEQRYLEDQTAMATVNVSIERTKVKKVPVVDEEDDDSGFLAGLETGWGGLKTFGVGLATVLGALLPWMVAAVVVAIPAVPLVRRYRRRQPAAPAVQA